MDKFEAVMLKQLAGKKVSQDCPVCHKKADYILHIDGTGKCTECNTEGKVDLTDVVKGLKSMGVTIG